MQEAVSLERAEGIGWLTLNRPQSLNAINDEVRSLLPNLIRQLEGDVETRAIVIQAAGDKAFCVGADVKEARPSESPVEARQRLKLSDWSSAVASASKPTIASIHGYCLGGGLELALACDIRIAAPNAIFALPEIDLGLLPGGGGTQRLARLVGLGPALDMMLSGDRIDATRAYELGLITRVSSAASTLRQDTHQLARKIAEKPPHAARLIKEAAVSGMDLPLGSGLQLERSLFTLLLSTEDRLEAAAAFREKRRTQFTGR